MGDKFDIISTKKEFIKEALSKPLQSCKLLYKCEIISVICPYCNENICYAGLEPTLSYYVHYCHYKNIHVNSISDFHGDDNENN